MISLEQLQILERLDRWQWRIPSAGQEAMYETLRDMGLLARIDARTRHETTPFFLYRLTPYGDSERRKVVKP